MAEFSILAYQPSQTFQQAQAREQKETDWHPEGTPDPNTPSGYDNSRPIMARTVNGQRETRAPNSAEPEGLNEAQQRSRNPGGLTDADSSPRWCRDPEHDLAQIGAINPATGQIAWAPNPNYQKEKPEPFAAPANQRSGSSGATRTAPPPPRRNPG